VSAVALAWRNLVRQRRRTALMGVVVAFGFAAFALAGGFIAQSFEGLREGTIRSVGQLQAVDRRAVSTSEETTLEFGIPDAARARAIVAKDAAVSSVLPRIDFVGLATNGTKSIPYLGVGAHSDWADANPDKVQKLYTIYKAAVEWVQKNPDEAAPLLAKGAPAEELKAVAAMIKSNERLAMKLTKANEIKKDIQAVYKAGMEINYLPSMPSDASIYDKPLN